MSVDPISPARAPDPSDISALLQTFVDRSSSSAEATVDDLVRVRAGGGLSIVSVEILDEKLDGAQRKALEVAFMGAANTALQKVALAAAAALEELNGKLKAERGEC